MFPHFVGVLHRFPIDNIPRLPYHLRAMTEPLLRPNAEVVRTGLPNPTPQGKALPSSNLPEKETRLVAGPFASHPPSSSPIPPGSYPLPIKNPLRDTSPTSKAVRSGRDPQVPPPTAAVPPTFTVSAEVELRDEMEYALGPLNPDFSLGPAKGGKKPKKAILWEVIRSLRLPSPAALDSDGQPVGPSDEGDLPLLSTSLPAAKQTLTQIRHSHHQLAQMLATGTKQEECALITGYSPVYISILKGDPTFKDLVAYYSTQREAIYVDAIERMRSLGLSTLDEIQSRLEEDPTQFTNRELFEQAELMIVKPMAATRGIIPIGGARANDNSGSGVQVHVNFIQTNPKEPAPQQPDIIDMKPDKTW